MKTSDKNKQATKTSDKLLPCPFCGGGAELLKGLCELDNYVMCLKCGCKTKLYNTKESAIKAWNTRKPMERIVERLEEESVLSEEERERSREQNPLQYERVDSYICAIDNAIEIVKEEGGIE
jgi:Lar family restriction alleviation protein